MSADEQIEAILEKADAALRQGVHPPLGSYLADAPPDCHGELYGLLVAQAITIQSEIQKPSWIDDYLDDNTWQYRQNVCRAVTAALFQSDRAALAERLGVRNFGEFAADKVVGFGGCATVFRGVHRQNPKQVVAIKLAHPRSDAAAALLDIEIQALCKARDVSGLPKFNSSGVAGCGAKFIVMDFVDGLPLDLWMKPGVPMPARLSVARQLARIMKDLHSVGGMSQGDLTPANIIIGGSLVAPRVTVVDLGNCNIGLQRNPLRARSAEYAAPELLSGKAPTASAATDLWSLGVVIHELLGNYPFGAISTDRTDFELARHFSQGPINSMDAGMLVHPQLVQAVKSCLIDDPLFRGQSITAHDLYLNIPSPLEYLSGLSSSPSKMPAIGTSITPALEQEQTWPELAAEAHVESKTSNVEKSLPRSTRRLAAPRMIAGLAGVIAVLAAGLGVWRLSQPPREITNAIGMKLRLIPAGQFVMGSPETEVYAGYPRDPTEAQRTVIMPRAFYMGECDVTRGEFRSFIEGSGYITDAEKLNQAATQPSDRQSTWNNLPFPFSQTDNDPVVCVSWNDAVAFTRWLTETDKSHKKYRLPLEAEWEYACRAGAATYSRFYTGDTLGVADANVLPDSGIPKFTTPVRSYKPNDWGLYDMHGNVWQWCWNDRSEVQPAGPLDLRTADAPPVSSGLKALRGGAFGSPASYARSANHMSDAPGNSFIHIGFRVVREQ